MIENIHVFAFDASADEVASVIRDKDFHLEVERSLEDTASAYMEMKGKLGGVLQFTMLSQKYEHGAFGSINRSSTVEERTEFRWNEEKHQLERETITPGGKGNVPVNFRCNYSIAPITGGSRITLDYTIEVKKFLIGSKLAKYVEKLFKASLVSFEDTLKRFLKRKESSPSVGQNTPSVVREKVIEREVYVTRCEHCGRRVRLEGKHCPNCGGPLEP